MEHLLICKVKLCQENLTNLPLMFQKYFKIFGDFELLLGTSFTSHRTVQSESKRPMRGARAFNLEKGRLSLKFVKGYLADKGQTNLVYLREQNCV